MHLRRRRDGQQWMLDLAVKLTGRPQNFEYDDREVPEGVKSYRMIPRALHKEALHQEQIAAAAAAAGHRETATRLYVEACALYREAQHAIVADTPYKRQLYADCKRTYLAAAEQSGRRIEAVEIPWEGSGTIPAWLHLAGPEPAPTVIFITGMDRTKESYPSAVVNQFRERGLHCLAIDGPGQGECILRGIYMTADNHERAVSAAVTYLLERGIVKDGQVGVCGVSMGTYWTARAAAHDPRVRATAGAGACYGSKLHIAEESSPRFKQVFMLMTGAATEAECDAVLAAQTTRGIEARIQCPSLLIAGEYDPLCPIEEAYEFFDHLGGPREIWVLEDEFHRASNLSGVGLIATQAHMADWLKRALAGELPVDHRVERYLKKHSGLGPYEPPMTHRPPVF